VVATVLTAVLGDQRIIAYSVQEGDVSLFGNTVVQSVREIVSNADLGQTVAGAPAVVAQVGINPASGLLLVEATGISR